MTLPSYSGYRFPRDIIQRAVWMYLRFTLNYRDVEELLAERGITTSYGRCHGNLSGGAIWRR
jgi:putative transposase